MTTPNITDKSREVFKAYADDAGNWSGMPLVGGNVGGTKGERGNLTQLKQAGLITTSYQDGCTWISFTPAGYAYACEISEDYKACFGEHPGQASLVGVDPESDLGRLIHRQVFGGEDMSTDGVPGPLAGQVDARLQTRLQIKDGEWTGYHELVEPFTLSGDILTEPPAPSFCESDRM